jgi:hypothetical protein
VGWWLLLLLQTKPLLGKLTGSKLFAVLVRRV